MAIRVANTNKLLNETSLIIHTLARIRPRDTLVLRLIKSIQNIFVVN